MPQNETIEIFKPEFYRVAYYLFGGFIIFFFIITLVIWNNTGGLDKIINVILIVCILLFLFDIIIYHTMCYEFYEEGIFLKCGPIKSKIQYKKIKKISKIVELDDLWIGFCRSPGYVFGLSYSVKYGWVTMYATSYKNVILIETDKKRYGITPKDEDRFLHILDEELNFKEGGR